MMERDSEWAGFLSIRFIRPGPGTELENMIARHSIPRAQVCNAVSGGTNRPNPICDTGLGYYVDPET